jgi:carboxymethylenebutenolidase
MGKPKLTTADYDPAVLTAFNDFVHGGIDRRAFLKRVMAVTASAAAASTIIESLLPNYAQAMDVSPDDPSINAEYLIYPSPDNWQGYVVSPSAEGKHPAVLVIPEKPRSQPLCRGRGKTTREGWFSGLVARCTHIFWWMDERR